MSVVLPVCRGPSRKWDFRASSAGRSSTRSMNGICVDTVVKFHDK